MPSKKEKKKVRGLTDTGRKRVPRRTEVGKTDPPPSLLLLSKPPSFLLRPLMKERRDPTIALSLSLSVRSVRETAFHLSNGQDLFILAQRLRSPARYEEYSFGGMRGPHNDGRTAAINFL